MGLYGFLTKLRNICFDRSLFVFKSKSFADRVKTICVGNLSVGGTGKSPMVESLINKSLQNGQKILLLSRGYKRRIKKNVFVQDFHSSVEVGDEPKMYAIEYKEYLNKNLFIYLCFRRDRGLEEALKDLGKRREKIDLVLMDDGFQHRYLKADKYLMLSLFNKPFFKDRVLPYGSLREEKIGAKRADVILYTKAPENLTPSSAVQYKEKTKEITGDKEIYFSFLSYEDLDIQKGDAVILLTAIARPKPILEHLAYLGIDVVRHYSFADHYKLKKKKLQEVYAYYKKIKHKFASSEVSGRAGAASEGGGVLGDSSGGTSGGTSGSAPRAVHLLTTQKDIVKIQALEASMDASEAENPSKDGSDQKHSWKILGVKHQILFNKEDEFYAKLLR